MAEIMENVIRYAFDTSGRVEDRLSALERRVSNLEKQMKNLLIYLKKGEEGENNQEG